MEFSQGKVSSATCQITIRQPAIAESERIFKTELQRQLLNNSHRNPEPYWSTRSINVPSSSKLVFVPFHWSRRNSTWITSGKLRAEHFSAMHNKINIRHYHTFGCPVYVLDARLQGAGFIPKWDERVRVGAYVGRSPIHAGNVSLILNISTGHVSPQFHVVFNETFYTVPSLKTGSIPASWNVICKNNRELATYKDFNLADRWSKSK